MRKKMKLFVVISCFLLTMCRRYEEGAPLLTLDGLSCRNYTAYFEHGLRSSDGLECYYACPDKTVVGPLDFQDDPARTYTEGDMDRRYCGIKPEFTPTVASISPSATIVASPTLASSPTIEVSLPTEVTPTASAPLLTGKVTMCDMGTNLISFRLVEPVPNVAGKTLTVQIADQESSCSMNPTNPSLMTCTIPAGVTFPARVVVSVDTVVVNDFMYDGLGCAQLTTPIATTTP
jgi:hypothetical protein